MLFDTHFGRVFAALALACVATVAAVSLAAEANSRSAALDAERARLEVAARAALEDARALVAGTGDRAAIEARASALGTRLTVVDARGEVLAESDATLPLANHANRPEVIAAAKDGAGFAERRSATTGRSMAYVALRIDDAQGRDLGVVRAAGDERAIGDAVARARGRLLASGGVVLVLGLCASYFVARALARPLQAIDADAARLAAGALEHRVRAEGPVEVRRLAASIDTLASEMSARLDGVQRARRELETILSSMAEGVVAVDANERVLLMNHAAALLLGLSVEIESGALLWQEVRFPELERTLRQALKGGGGWNGDALSPRQDGRMLRLSVAPVARDDGDGARSFQGAVALLSDVTALRQLEQMRIDFVANVSHELRTPLAAVMGALETIGDAAGDEGVRARFLDIANRNAARLQAIVSDLLDLSQIEAEGDSMPLEPVRLDQPLRTAASALTGAAEAKQIRLELPAPLDQPAWVNGNVQRLEQVFTNLLENAIKYTPKGGRVVARVRTTAREACVDVEDTGVGIPAASLPRVFERFYRVDRSRSRDMGGTGLGLAIVKHVLRAHGGGVSVESTEGRGTTFTVTLPRIAGPRERRVEAA